MKVGNKLWLSLLLLASTTATQAKVKLPALFADGMVMQQQTQANLWGSASPDKPVTVTTSWDGKSYTVRADKSGSWQLSVPTPAAGGPYTLTFDEGERTTLSNILIGEVWLCSGQSNMEMPMKGFTGQPVEGSTMAILKSTNPRLRLFTVKRNSSLVPLDDVTGSWSEATPQTVANFSATAYYFGRLVEELLQVPVGLVVASWGGSACEAWMHSDWLRTFPDAKIPQTEADIKSKNRTPTVLYNGMLHPLIGMSMRGVIWYQGEDNCNRYQTYADMFAALIAGWRSEWKQGDFPFYYCQIAPFDYGEKINSAYLREAQAQVELRVPHTGMAVLMDAGLEKCIHPSQKQQAGERLALLALTKTYGITGVYGESPVYEKMEVKGDTLILSFQRSKLWVADKDRDYRLEHFTVAGEDKQFHPAQAWISGNKVYVKSQEVKQPVAARYGFENFVEGDLFGGNGLPLSSFRTDKW